MPWRSIESVPLISGKVFDLWVNGERYTDCHLNLVGDYCDKRDVPYIFVGEPTHWFEHEDPTKPTPCMLAEGMASHTDLAAQLKARLQQDHSLPIAVKELLARAAHEVDRYCLGERAWKGTAEAKDTEIARLSDALAKALNNLSGTDQREQEAEKFPGWKVSAEEIYALEALASALEGGQYVDVKSVREGYALLTEDLEHLWKGIKSLQGEAGFAELRVRATKLCATALYVLIYIKNTHRGES